MYEADLDASVILNASSSGGPKRWFKLQTLTVAAECARQQMLPNLTTLLVILVTLQWEVILSVEEFEDVPLQYHQKCSVDGIGSARSSSWSWWKRRLSHQCIRTEKSLLFEKTWFFYLIVLLWLSLLRNALFVVFICQPLIFEDSLEIIFLKTMHTKLFFYTTNYLSTPCMGHARGR